MNKLCLILIGVWCVLGFAGETADGPKVIVDISTQMRGSGRGLSTIIYIPMKTEIEFIRKINEGNLNHWVDTKMPPAEGEKVDPEEKKKQEKKDKEDREKLQKYTLADQAGNYVGWFGIVRDISYDKEKKTTTLLIEHKYFDGMTDSHIQIVSIYGGGDFLAVISRETEEIHKLQLVRVFGKVEKQADGRASLNVEYARVWQWGLFSFMNYGKDKSNKKWVEIRKIDGNDVYTPHPDLNYYTSVLGSREDFTPKEYLYTRQYKKGFQVFKAGAEKGDAQMQYLLGFCYSEGIGVEKDAELAAEWFGKASEQGHVLSQYQMAGCYLSGKGVEKDDLKAFKLLEKAAATGFDLAQFALGYHYFNGIGVEKDLEKAKEWIEKAAAQGNRYAKKFLEKEFSKNPPEIEPIK